MSRVGIDSGNISPLLNAERPYHLVFLCSHHSYPRLTLKEKEKKKLTNMTHFTNIYY